MLNNSILIQLCSASLPHNCLHVSNIFCQPLLLPVEGACIWDKIIKAV